MKIPIFLFSIFTLVSSGSSALARLDGDWGFFSIDPFVQRNVGHPYLQTYQIPTNSNCATTFTAGDDAVLRRIGYCHRALPNSSESFFAKGLDVPAGFLRGYTLSEIQSVWTAAAAIPPVLSNGLGVTVSVDSLRLLNFEAGATWSAHLACANGDPDEAREFYRNGARGCADQNAIHSRLVDLRKSLVALSMSVDQGSMYSRTLADADWHRVPAILENTRSEEEAFRRHLQFAELIHNPEQMNASFSAGVLVLPRMHPLLVQILVEEMVSVGEFTFNNVDRPDQRYAYFLKVLSYFISDRACASLGLWPSANRAALSVVELSQAREIQHSWPARQPWLRTQATAILSGRSLAVTCRSRQGEGTGLLPQVYFDGRDRAHTDLLKMREQYLK